MVTMSKQATETEQDISKVFVFFIMSLSWFAVIASTDLLEQRMGQRRVYRPTPEEVAYARASLAYDRLTKEDIRQDWKQRVEMVESPSFQLTYQVSGILATVAAAIAVIRIFVAVVIPFLQRHSKTISRFLSQVFGLAKRSTDQGVSYLSKVSAVVVRICSIDYSLTVSLLLAVIASSLYFSLQHQMGQVSDDPFDVLQVAENATKKEIRSAFRSISRQYLWD